MAVQNSSSRPPRAGASPIYILARAFFGWRDTVLSRSRCPYTVERAALVQQLEDQVEAGLRSFRATGLVQMDVVGLDKSRITLRARGGRPSGSRFDGEL